MSHLLDTLEWPVRTRRLLLRRASADDLDPTWAYRRLPEVYDWLSAATSTYDAYRESYLREDRLADALVVELDGRVIGDLMLRVEDAWAQQEVADQAQGVQGELGWVLDPAFGGQGYATEAVRALIGLCFGPLGLRRLHADCFFDNEPSWRLMERLGMRREQHTVRESLHRTKGWLDGLSYALLADEWDADPLVPSPSWPRSRRLPGSGSRTTPPNWRRSDASASRPEPPISPPRGPTARPGFIR
jgi:RimJ/RimL family protein N-acetyltransferase